MTLIDVKCLKIALLVCFFHGVVSYPKPDVNDRDDLPDKHARGSVEKRVYFLNSGASQIEAKSNNNKIKKNKYRHKVLSKDNDELFDEKLKRHFKFNHEMNQNKNTDSTHNDDTTQNSEKIRNSQRKGDVIAGKIEMSHGNIDGEVDLPDQLSGDKNYFVSKKHTGNLKRPKFERDPTSLGDDQSKDDDTLTGNINIDNNEYVEGTIDLPDHGGKGRQSDTGNGNEHQGDNADTLSGEVKIRDDGNVEGSLNLPDDVDNGQPGSQPGSQPVAENGKKGQGKDGLSGEIQIHNDGDVEGTINLPDDAENRQPGAGNGGHLQAGNSKKGQGNDADSLSGEINVDDNDNVEGTIKLPGDGDDRQLGTNKGGLPDAGLDNKGESNGADTISGEINVDDEGDVQGMINLPDDDQPDAGNGKKGQTHDADTLSGEINTDDNGNVEGSVNLLDDHGYDPPIVGYGNKGQVSEAGTISGEINIDDDGNVDGTLNLPDDDDNSQPGTEYSNIGQVNKADTLSGEINIGDDGNIEGTVNLPDDGDFGQLDAENSNKGQVNEAGTISGEINIGDDGNVEGTVILPDGGGNGQPGSGYSSKNHIHKADTISGEINIDDDGNVEGTVNLPDDGDFVQPDAGNGNEGQVNEAVNGEININDNGNVEGTVDIPDDGDNGQPGAENTGKVITGSVEINDDDVKGTINLPDLPDGDKAENIGHGGENSNAAIGHDDSQNQSKDKGNCWMNLNSQKYLDALNVIDGKYIKVRRQYQDEIGPEFDKKMMEVLMSSQGKAPRAIHQAHGNPNTIPAGLNLGGFGMMRMPGSMLFFHRMKLRNSTVFHVDFLEANMMDMSLMAHLTLNDLHLQGAYERATTADNIAVMYITPNYGEIEVLLKMVFYKMQGRLRMLNNRLMVELINSNILTTDILLSYANSSASAREIAVDSIEDFVNKMKCDLDIWLKDYFNDYLMYFGIVGGGKKSEIQLYEKQKTIKANEYADHAIRGIKNRLRSLNAADVRLPSFTLLSVLHHKIELGNGVLRGLDSIYRRSVAMTKKDNQIRILDMMIGFSNLKVEYQYVATIVRGEPPLTGLLILSADELSARLEVAQVDGSQTVDLNIDSILQLKSESLTIEGPANRLIASFKYILENPIIAIMTNVMKHNVKMLKTLSRCEPNLWGSKDKNETSRQGPTDEKAHIFQPSVTRPAKERLNNSGYENKSKKTEEDTKWSDYTFSKNDSVEIIVPVNGKNEKIKLNRNENFVLSKLS